MWDVIETGYDFSENVVVRVKEGTAEQVRTIAMERYGQRYGQVIRVFWRPVRPILASMFHENERKIMEVALQELTMQKAYLNGQNLYSQIEHLISRTQFNIFIWADAELIATTLSKLKGLSFPAKQRILTEFTDAKR